MMSMLISEKLMAARTNLRIKTLRISNRVERALAGASIGASGQARISSLTRLS
jgi:hypothetical protein